MTSVLFGMIAALCWGIHDFLVRNVSQTASVAPLLFTTLTVGAVLLAPLTYGHWAAMGSQAYSYAALSGLAYMVASFGLYRAFSIGPVRLVAPICGAYPIVSLLIAAAQGRAIPMVEVLTVLAVICGVALVARQTDSSETPANRGKAISWAIIGAVGFAATFGLGQAAARAGSELPATLISRLVAMALVAGVMLVQGTRLSGLRTKLPLLCAMGALDVTALSFVLMAGTVAHPEYAAVTSSVFGIITILLAWRFLGERMRPIQWLGVAVVFCGIARLAA